VFRSVPAVAAIMLALALIAPPVGRAAPSSGSAPGGAARAPSGPDARLVYGGRLVDGEGRPVSGIFPLTFHLYAARGARKSSWKTSLHVAVDNGVYAVELGRDKPLPKGLAVEKAEIGVALTGQRRELVREALGPKATAVPAERVEPIVITVESPMVGARPGAGGKSYADLSGMAYEAERAKVAERVGGLGEAEIRELARAATPSSAPSRARIGAEKRTTDRAGGADGRPYSLTCPAGYVVTGISGGAGALVDSISLICSPLE
jgi:hypothetical protein